MVALPEQQARQNIDAMLATAGWAVQDCKAYAHSSPIGFFNQNLVMEPSGARQTAKGSPKGQRGGADQYGHERAVADGVNVGYEVYRIRTRVTEAGDKVEKGFYVDRRYKETRRRWERLDEDLAFTEKELDRSIVVPSQIRTVLTAYRDALFTELFPSRALVPKTLIFAKDDSHAEDIVQLVWEVFGKGTDFCKKITYQAKHPTTGKPSPVKNLSPRLASDAYENN